MEGPVGRGVSPMEGALLPRDLVTFDVVQDRLVEAMITCWRYPDRERGWQMLRSAWPEVLREASAGDYDARGGEASSSDVAIRPASLTRREIAEMEEAFAWAGMLEPRDRKLVGMVIEQLARGQRAVRWSAMVRRMGLDRGADGLRKRYSRAITSICAARNGGFACPSRVNTNNVED